jgi:hypothetical protein
MEQERGGKLPQHCLSQSANCLSWSLSFKHITFWVALAIAIAHYQSIITGCRAKEIIVDLIRSRILDNR